MSKMSEEEVPDTAVLDLFLMPLEEIPPLAGVAMNFRTSQFASRKPNVPLSELPRDSIQKMVNPLNHPNGRLNILKPRCLESLGFRVPEETAESI